MTLKKHNRFELAEQQLETAIGLFVSGRDRFSVITLAGAADVILSTLITNRGLENFTEFAIKQEQARDSSFFGTKESHGRAINDLLCINQIKHMDEGEDGFLELEPEECAIGAILKALSNYAMIAGGQSELVLVFRTWVKLNLDPKKYNIDCDPNWKPYISNA